MKPISHPNVRLHVNIVLFIVAPNQQSIVSVNKQRQDKIHACGANLIEGLRSGFHPKNKEFEMKAISEPVCL